LVFANIGVSVDLGTIEYQRRVTLRSTRIPEQFDCPTAANSQFDIDAIESWEMEGGALHRHSPAGTSSGSCALPANRDASDLETQESVAFPGAISSSRSGETMMASRYPKFRNDRAVPEIRIGAREFNCIGVSPPQDHPHVYINIGDQDTILCPYSRYRYDSRLAPFEADPQDCLFVDPGGV
jgi:uncharacterized Zn-finger protein